MIDIKTYGRTTIKANYTEEELLNGKNVENVILDILENSIPIHEKNKTETRYLYDYYYGEQDIYTEKEKYTRPEINNKTVENWAYACIDFKKNILLSKPIQYTQLNDKAEEEISLLNKYVRACNKKAKDLMLYEDVLICGRGFRYNNKALNSKEEKKTPFCIINCEPEYTEVVYSSKLGNEQIMSFIETPMEFIRTNYDPKTGETTEEVVPYQEYTVYTRNKQYVFNNKSGTMKFINSTPLLYDEHLITEYYVNRKRISLIELGKDLFNDINYLESMDKDDMEQYVNAIMVFTNCEVSEEDLGEIRELGAVCINSTDQKKASVDLLQNRLNATDTQTYYTRLVNASHQILGIPLASDNGSVVSGDTGKAKLTGQGFTSAGIRAEGDETMFGMCDMKALNVILEICKNSSYSEIKTLEVSDIDNRFQRDMTDNLLVKTQGLLNLYSCDIPRKYANSLVNLFGDPNAVTKEQETLFGPQQSQLNGNNHNNKNTVSNKDKVSFQNNDIENISQKDEQEQ